MNGLIVEFLILGSAFSATALILHKRDAMKRFRDGQVEFTFNIGLAIVDSLAFTPPLVILLRFSQSLFAEILPRLPLTWMWSLMPSFTIIAVIIVGDFIGYWRHRLEHFRWLWPSHHLHHSDAAMSWTTGYRFHPFNRLTTSLIDGLALYAMGFPPYAVLANSIFRHWYGIWIHADLPWTYGPLRQIFVSPTFHRWHHVTETEAQSKNFATVFSLYDLVFGTYYLPERAPGQTGVDGPAASSRLAQFVLPLRPSAYRSTP